jgi:osmotically-inducible protein OsmY
MLTENASTSLQVGGRLSQSYQPTEIPLSPAVASKYVVPAIDGAMELRAAMQLNIHPSLREFASSVQFCYRNGCMVMAGVLPSYFLKQLAQEAVRKLEGVEAVDNRIYVETSYREDPNSNRGSAGKRFLPR